MESAISRRSFLRGKSLSDKTTTVVIRPPGADLNTFSQLCTDCDACHSICPEGIISVDPAGRPFLDFTQGACTFCGECTSACPTDALNKDRLANWSWKARIKPNCWSLNAITCRMCQDTCEEAAIGFKLKTGGCAEPVIDLAQCTGCGGCVSVCPADAVEFFQNTDQQKEDVA